MGLSRVLILFLVLMVGSYSCSVFKSGKTSESKNSLVLISTNHGDIKVLLYDQTPGHRDNFLSLVDSGFYDSLLFHRVIKGFMIQGGDPESRNAPTGQSLGNGGPGYTLPAEIIPGLIHKKGALAAARLGDDVNPEQRSSGSQFYIVQGTVSPNSSFDRFSQSINHNKKMKHLQSLLYSEENKEILTRIQYCQAANLVVEYDSLIHSFDPVLEAYMDSVGRHSFSEYQKQTYSTIGGAPHLDGSYTVFGEVVEGIEVVDKIVAVKTDGQDRPIEDVIILSAKVVKK